MKKFLALGLSFVTGLAIAADPNVERLSQRLRSLEAGLPQPTLAAYERLQARQAIDAVTIAKSRRRAAMVRVAERRVDIAEIAARTEQLRNRIDLLNQERSDLLVEASRLEAERARMEAERLRVHAQIQAEEAERLRLAAEQQSQARQNAELVLDGVAKTQAAKLREARRREAELAKREAELMTEDAKKTP